MSSIYLSAGEASGDKHASMLAKALRARAADIEIFGMGGEEMAAAGVEITHPIDRQAVVGFMDVLPRLPALWKAMKRAVENCRFRRPDLAVLVDYPGFHLKLGKKLRGLGVPVVLYIAPQVWAWKAGRIHTVAKVARKLLVIFEFEALLFEKAGVDVEFVGHPLLDEINPSAPGGKARKALGLDSETPLVAIMPGTRKPAWRRLLPVYLGAARRVRDVRPDTAVAVGTPDGSADLFGSKDATKRWDLPPTVRTHDLLRDATAGMYCSGTVSLEAAILGCPGIEGYKMNWFNYQIAKRLVKLQHIALPNILLGDVVMPEFIQHDLTPEAAATEILTLITCPERRELAAARLLEVRKKLGPPGASERAAKAILRLL